MKPPNQKNLTASAQTAKAVVSSVRKPQQVRRTIHRDPRTYEAGTLASLGFSHKMIRSTTGLKPSQITYRLREAGVRILDYRNGTSDIAAHILSHARKVAQEQFTAKLREKLNL